jgi:hypothetical protein
MENREVGKLTLNIDAEALRSVIGSGRLLELADTLSKEAAAQISAQLVEHVAGAALKPEGLKGGASVDVTYIFDGGDFGTRPPRPHWGVVQIPGVPQPGLLQQIARTGTEG